MSVNAIRTFKDPNMSHFHWQQRILKRLLAWEDSQWQVALGQMIKQWQSGQPQQDIVCHDLMRDYLGCHAGKTVMARRVPNVLRRYRAYRRSLRAI